jgi:hypothetical protein
MKLSRFSLVLCLAALGACGRLSGDQAGPAAVVYEASAPAGPCGAVVQQQAIEGHAHVAVCSDVEYGTKPPSSGNHYPFWAAYQNYTTAIPEGFWVHNLEHGSIVLTYNCPGGCDSDVAAAIQMLANLPQDSACLSIGDGVLRKTVMTPDPKLDVPFAASAWGWTLRARCFDPVAFQAFAMAHYDQGLEGTCANGEVAPSCGD